MTCFINSSGGSPQEFHEKLLPWPQIKTRKRAVYKASAGAPTSHQPFKVRMPLVGWLWIGADGYVPPRSETADTLGGQRTIFRENRFGVLGWAHRPYLKFHR